MITAARFVPGAARSHSPHSSLSPLSRLPLLTHRLIHFLTSRNMFFRAAFELPTGAHARCRVGITVSHMAKMCAGTAALSEL